MTRSACWPACWRPGYRQEPGHRAKWLWRTLRAPELAGLDPAEALARAIGERDLVGARDIPSVIDARLATAIATMMDERKDRIGEHAARDALPGAVATLGPVPDDQQGRQEWQKRAASIGAWRELSGYAHPADPIGPEPVTGTPEFLAAWHEALAALGPEEGTARAGAWDARLAALRATAEAAAARQRGRRDEVARQQELAASYQPLHDAYQQRETALAAAMADRAAWEEATRARRRPLLAWHSLPRSACLSVSRSVAACELQGEIEPRLSIPAPTAPSRDRRRTDGPVAVDRRLRPAGLGDPGRGWGVIASCTSALAVGCPAHLVSITSPSRTAAARASARLGASSLRSIADT